MKPNFMLDGVAMTTKFQHLSEVNRETVNIISNGSFPYSAIDYSQNFFKGSDRLCMVVELSMQCCGKLRSVQLPNITGHSL